MGVLDPASSGLSGGPAGSWGHLGVPEEAGIIPPGVLGAGRAVLGRISPILAPRVRQEMVLLLLSPLQSLGPKAWAGARALLPWGTQESRGLHPFGGQC